MEQTGQAGVSRRGFIAAVPALGFATPALARLASADRGSDATLRRAVERLRTTASVMMVGAHPDDERSGMLAALRFGHAMRISIALATRGESGQNAIGPERGLALGALRTREMEEAARVLDASVEWLADGPSDGFSDFGYSRSTADTLHRWGEGHLTLRMAEAIRRQRPDILIAAFPDVEGQHAHHRAVVSAAAAAIALAARSDMDLEGLPVWRTPIHFNPVAIADRLPGDVEVESGAIDPVSGLSFGAIGEASRILHRSQNQGAANSSPPPLWILRPASGAIAHGDMTAIASSFSLGALGGSGASAATARLLYKAQQLVEALAKSDGSARIDTGVRLAQLLRQIEAGLAEEERDALLHRILRKQREVDDFLHLACGVAAELQVQPATLTPGTQSKIEFLTAAPARGRFGTLHLRDGLVAGKRHGTMQPVAVSADARPTSSFPRRFDPIGGNGDLWAVADLRIGDHIARRRIDPDGGVNIVPADSLRFDVPALLFNLAHAREAKRIAIDLARPAPTLRFNLPEGWSVERVGEGLAVQPPEREGRATIGAAIEGRPAYSVTRMAYPHIGVAYSIVEANLPLLALDVRLPAGAKVCCLTDDGNLGYWIKELGFDTHVTKELPDLISQTTLIAASDAFAGEVSREMSAAVARWIEQGGHLVLLAQRRTRDGATGLRLPVRLEIASPRNIHRITLPNAAVAMPDMTHPLLAGPNPIGTADWEGWHQERAVGLASAWDEAFVPLISTGDPGQVPTRGALLSARFGKGRITFSALALERQLDALVPGAFRLLANLLQPAS